MTNNRKFLSFVLASLSLFPFAVKAEGEAVATSGYQNGFFIQSPEQDFTFKIGGRNKTLFAYSNQNNMSLADIGLQETRLRLSAGLHKNTLRFALEYDFATGSLKDFYFDTDFGVSWSRLQIGKYKAQFSRQAIISSGKLNFTETSLAVNAFSQGRVIAAMLHSLEGRPVEWAVAVIQNGFLGRVGYLQEGMDAYSETDFEGGDLRLAFAANGYVKTAFSDFELLGFAGGIDAILKAFGSTTLVELFVGRPNLSVDLLADANLTAEKQQIGFMAQLGYLVTKTIEPSVRYSFLTTPSATSFEHELLLGANFFWFQNKAKIQLEGGVHIQGSNVNKGLANLLFQFEL